MFIAGLGIGPTLGRSRSSSRTPCRSGARRRDLEPDVLPPDRRLGRPGRPGHALRDAPDERSSRSVDPARSQLIAAGVPPQGGAPEPRRRERPPTCRGRQGPGHAILVHDPRPDPGPGGAVHQRASSTAIHEAFSLAIGEMFLIGAATTLVALAASAFMHELAAPHDPRSSRDAGAVGAEAAQGEPRRSTSIIPEGPTHGDASARPRSPPVVSSDGPAPLRGCRAGSTSRATIGRRDRPAPVPPRTSSPRAPRRRVPRCLAARGAPAGTDATGHARRPRLLLAHTALGLCAVDDRCPHMSAPLSIGALDGCVVACPLHDGRLRPGVRRAGPDAHHRRPRPDGAYHPHVVAARREPKEDPPGHEGRGAPPDPRPALPLLPGPGRRRPGSRSRFRA